MNQSVVHLFFILVLFNSNGQINENDWSKMQLKGNVYILEEKVSDFTTNYVFSRDGFIEKISNNHEETIIDYDVLKNKLEEKTYYKSNGKRFLFKSKIFENNFLKFIYFYNDQGIEVSKVEYVYSNNLISKEIEYSNKQVHSIFEYNYDDKGNKIEIKKFNSANKLILKNKFKFDKHNNKTEFSIFDWNTDKVLETYYYNYNDKNELIFSYSLDNNGNLLRPTEFSYKYEYDAKGNWIYFVEYINKIKKSNTETDRKINYYE